MGPKKQKAPVEVKNTENRAKLLNEKLASVEAEIAQNGEVNAMEAIKVMYLLFLGTDSLYNIKEMSKKLHEMEEKVEKMAVQNDHITKLEEKIRALELQSHQTKVILRNIPLADQKEKKEKFSDTKTAVQQLLDISGQKMVSILDFYRLYPKNDAKKGVTKHPPLLVSFSSLQELRIFTQKLRVIKKDKKFLNLILENSCPPSLMAEYNSAQKEAFQLRSDKKLVTRCVITKSGVKLLAKKIEDSKFTQVTYPRDI